MKGFLGILDGDVTYTYTNQKYIMYQNLFLQTASEKKANMTLVYFYIKIKPRIYTDHIFHRKKK